LSFWSTEYQWQVIIVWVINRGLIGPHINRWRAIQISINNARFPIQVNGDTCHKCIVTRINYRGIGLQTQVPGRGGCRGRVYGRDEHWIDADIAPNVHKAGIRRSIAAAACALGQTVRQDNGGVVVDGGGNGAGTAAVLVVPKDAVAHYRAVCYSHSKIR